MSKDIITLMSKDIITLMSKDRQVQLSLLSGKKNPVYIMCSVCWHAYNSYKMKPFVLDKIAQD